MGGGGGWAIVPVQREDQQARGGPPQSQEVYLVLPPLNRSPARLLRSPTPTAPPPPDSSPMSPPKAGGCPRWSHATLTGHSMCPPPPLPPCPLFPHLTAAPRLPPKRAAVPGSHMPPSRGMQAAPHCRSACTRWGRGSWGRPGGRVRGAGGVTEGGGGGGVKGAPKGGGDWESGEVQGGRTLEQAGM